MQKDLKNKIIKLREKGKTYKEIRSILKIHIPKATLSYYSKKVNLPKNYMEKVQKLNLLNLAKARECATKAMKAKKEKELSLLRKENTHLVKLLANGSIAKIAIVMLYLGEGGKNRKRAAVLFGNSDPFIISMFLYLLRYCFDIDERKFRCTVQCRYDQNIKKLEKFWSKITNIPPEQFYKTRIDARTIGKPTKKHDYKGVCRIDYFSAKILEELLEIPKLIKTGP